MPEGPAAALLARLRRVPDAPGVYLLKNERGDVIYVGKAKRLRARIGTYLRGGDERSQVRFLVRRLADFETVVTSNEKEALILENNLIKQYRPRYNIRLKDDKSYVSVKVTMQDAWPRVLVTRRVVRDGSRYLGPFHSAGAVRETLDTVRKAFPLRTCSDSVFRNRSRPCIEYDIKRCLAPCVLPVDRETYGEHLRQAIALIEGRSAEVTAVLGAQMAQAAAQERFEDAARLRDQMLAIEKTQQPQQAVTHGGADQDVVGLYREGGSIEATVLLVRDGKLVDSRSWTFEGWELGDGAVLEGLLTQVYQARGYPPPAEILLPTAIEDARVREEYLSERRGRAVRVRVPRRGDRRRLVEMAVANARQRFAERHSALTQGRAQVEALRRRLRLRGALQRLECLDIATLHGRETVGAIVCFVDGQPWKDGYRRYRLRTLEGTDDFAAVAEVLRRRFRDPDASRPDLLVIDGGPGQVSAAGEALREAGVEDVAVVGLAKQRVVRDATATQLERRPERVWLPGRKNPIVLRSNSTALFILQRVRDEAHRVANEYHRQLRRRERLASPLDQVPGIGPVLRRRLLRTFSNVAAIAAAPARDIAAVPGVGAERAARIKDALLD